MLPAFAMLQVVAGSVQAEQAMTANPDGTIAFRAIGSRERGEARLPGRVRACRKKRGQINYLVLRGIHVCNDKIICWIWPLYSKSFNRY